VKEIKNVAVIGAGAVGAFYASKFFDAFPSSTFWNNIGLETTDWLPTRVVALGDPEYNKYRRWNRV